MLLIGTATAFINWKDGLSGSWLFGGKGRSIREFYAINRRGRISQFVPHLSGQHLSLSNNKQINAFT